MEYYRTVADLGIGIESYFPNTIVNIFHSEEWKKLVETIGDSLFIYLLVHCYLFISVTEHSNSYVQLTGLPIDYFCKAKISLFPPQKSTIPTSNSSNKKKAKKNKEANTKPNHTSHSSSISYCCTSFLYANDYSPTFQRK